MVTLQQFEISPAMFHFLSEWDHATVGFVSPGGNYHEGVVIEVEPTEDTVWLVIEYAVLLPGGRIGVLHENTTIAYADYINAAPIQQTATAVAIAAY